MGRCDVLHDLMTLTAWVASWDVPKGSLACFTLGGAMLVSSAVAWVSDWCDQAPEGPHGPNPRVAPIDYQALLDAPAGQVRRRWRR